MWTIRRTSSSYTRTRGLKLGASHACTKLESAGTSVKERLGDLDPPKFLLSTWFTPTRFYSHCLKTPPHFFLGSCGLSSQAGTRSGGEDSDLEEGFSELDSSEISEASKDTLSSDDDEVAAPEGELSGDDDDDIGESPESEPALDFEADAGKASRPKKRSFSELTSIIVQEPFHSLTSALDKYVADGKDLERSEISNIMINLRRRKMYSKALKFSEWLETSGKLDFTLRDYAARLDLLCKVQGIQRGEVYIGRIPESCRVEVMYRTLLANCVALGNVKKSEEIFNKMKELGFPPTAFACNQMLLLYKRIDKKKIADVLVYMENENVKPTLFTYRLLIDTKGLSNDIAGMDQLVEAMKAEGVEPDLQTLAVIAKHYSGAGLKVKAESLLKEMEASNLKDMRSICSQLLPLYAELGKEDEVERIWKMCESKPLPQDCIAAVSAFGKLKKVEEAEAVFDLLSKRTRLTSKYYSAMLRVYANNKMLDKGKEMVKRMGESGCRIGPLTWDALVKLYVDAGEVERADSILHKALSQLEKSPVKPLFSTFMNIMDQYARSGDVHNAEKIFYRMRQVGYVCRIRPYQALLQAYVKAKAPAYGIKERMVADNISPNRTLMTQLAEVNPFKKTPVSDLLD